MIAVRSVISSTTRPGSVDAQFRRIQVAEGRIVEVVRIDVEEEELPFLELGHDALDRALAQQTATAPTACWPLPRPRTALRASAARGVRRGPALRSRTPPRSALMMIGWYSMKTAPSRIVVFRSLTLRERSHSSAPRAACAASRMPAIDQPLGADLRIAEHRGRARRKSRTAPRCLRRARFPPSRADTFSSSCDSALQPASPPASGECWRSA